MLDETKDVRILVGYLGMVKYTSENPFND